MTTVLTLAAFLQGCALFDPYVAPDKVYLDRFQGPAPDPNAAVPAGMVRSLQAATDYAEAMREAYYHAISDQAVLNSTAGLMLIPISAAGLYFGIAGPREALLPTAIAGGATFLGANYLHSQPRELIYAAGTGAVTCASAAMSPIRSAIIRLRNTQLVDPGKQAAFAAREAQYPTLSPLIVELNTATDAVDALVRSPDLTSAPVQVARDRVAAARALAKEAAEADVAIQTAGDTLFSAIQRIRSSVTNALIAEEPNLTALASTLSSALPLRAGQIVSQAALQPATPKTKPPLNKEQVQAAEDAAARVRNALAQPLTDLATASENVRAVVDLVKTGPSKAYLDACGVDVKTAGLNFAVTPDSGVSFGNGDVVESSTLSISGGQSPYGATWDGPTPDDLNVAITYEADGKGVLVVSEKAAIAKEANYQLRVHDAGSNAAVVNVKVAAQAATKKTGSGTGTGTGGAAAVQPGETEFNKEMVQMLVDRKCMKAPDAAADQAAVDKAVDAGVEALYADNPDLKALKLGLTPLHDKLKADPSLQFHCG